ncbi:MAG: hypothetical protein HGA72_02140 [Chlorobiaceae bacterium]|jgi:hypothetical protein|nr:hypothetical protein [Chlorobiaceae bacterium]NTW63215.1 hypothetical protein [Chlorobiaceae bacterium]
MISDKNFLQPQWNANRTLLGYWGLAFFLLLIGTFVPFTEIIHNLFFLDTLAHLALYSMLSFIPLVLFRSRKTAFLFSLAMTPIGYLLEMLHMMVTGTNFSAINALSNNAGVVAGIAAGFIVRLKGHYERDKTKA